jgi:hypothetical protein
MRSWIPAVCWLVACGEQAGESRDSDPVADTWRSVLFPSDWDPNVVGEEGKFLHDFSFAGYRHGEEPPIVAGPEYPVVGADPTGNVDATAAFQAAIDAASVGGGVVVIPSGLFRLDGTLQVRASHVVLRGQGPSSQLAFTRSAGMTDRAHLTWNGGASWGEAIALRMDVVAREVTLPVAAGHTLSAGDRIALGWEITPEFVADHGMTGTWVAFLGQWKPFFRRTVVEAGPDWITVDVPVRYPALVRDRASVRREQGGISEVGVEDLAVSTAVAWFDAWKQDRSAALRFEGVHDGWVRRVTSFASPFFSDSRDLHLQSGGIQVVGSDRFTIVDTQLSGSQNRGEGGNGYLFEISRANEVLIRDSIADGGRHNFIQNWDFGTSGCVWLRTTSRNGRAMVSDSVSFGLPGLSEYHHSLAMGNLVDDSIADDGWQSVNRGSFSSGAGHAGTQNVFWNLRGQGQLRSMQYGWGYVIGTQDLEVVTALDAPDPFDGAAGTTPEDHVEGREQGANLEPRSLYEAQRDLRLSR